jgi:glycosyltransferase involved in cell wall biosynthesis
MNQPKGCLAIMFDRIGPYHFSRLKAFGATCPTVAIESYGVDDVYQWDLVTGSDSFKRVTLFPAKKPEMGGQSALIQRVRAALDECRPAAVAIPGWVEPAALSALQWCLSRRIPAIMMSDSTAWDHPRIFWKEWVKGNLVRSVSAALVAGTPHATYIENLGLAADRVFAGYDVVDNEHFGRGADLARQLDPELRRKHGLPQNYFLASARFVEKKNLIRLVQAYAQYRDLAKSRAKKEPGIEIWDLVVLGEGPMGQAIRDQIATLNLKEHAWLYGFRQYDELPIFYGLAQAFVHASTTEQWGLVVNEAMASGLPVLVSNRCGCAMDLVKEGVTGFSFDPLNLEQMAESMYRFSSNPAGLSRMGKAGRNLVANWGCNRFADGLMQAMETAIQRPVAKTPVLAPLLIKYLLTRNAG